MALPIFLNNDDDDNDSIDSSDAIAIPADFKTLLNHATHGGSDAIEIDEAVAKITSGEIVPSWKGSTLGDKLPTPDRKPLVEASYKPIGELSAETVINTPYDNFRHLEGIVQDITKFVQKQLSDHDRLEDITQARAKEEGKYEEMVRYLDQMILNHMTRKAMASPEDTKVIVAMVVNEILGLGPIQPLWEDSEISEIMINGAFDIRIEKKGRIQIAKGIQFRDQAHLIEVCQQILGEVGRRIDVAHPLEDGRLRDMSRINVTHPAVGPSGPYVTIRRFSDTAFSMEKLVEMKSMTEEMAHIVGNLVYSGCSIVIAGSTGSGKTSMLNALSGCISNEDRIITIEDNLELRLHPDKFVSSLEARPASSSGDGAVTIRDLVKNTLRMRPDRIIVGEIRDSSAYDMLQAMNTGHDGSLTTVHAEDAVGAIERLRNLVDQEGSFNSKTALTLVAGGVDLFLTIGRYEDGSRRISGVYEVPRNIEHLDSGEIRLDPIPLWEFSHDETTKDGSVIGHYVKMNDISEQLIRRHRLDRRRKLSLEELYDLSKVEERVKGKAKTTSGSQEQTSYKSTHEFDMANAAPKRPERPSMPSLTDFKATKVNPKDADNVISGSHKPIVVGAANSKAEVLEIESTIESIAIEPLVVEEVLVEDILVESIMEDAEGAEPTDESLEDSEQEDEVEDVFEVDDSHLLDDSINSKPVPTLETELDDHLDTENGADIDIIDTITDEPETTWLPLEERDIDWHDGITNEVVSLPDVFVDLEFENLSIDVKDNTDIIDDNDDNDDMTSSGLPDEDSDELPSEDSEPIVKKSPLDTLLDDPDDDG